MAKSGPYQNPRESHPGPSFERKCNMSVIFTSIEVFKAMYWIVPNTLGSPGWFRFRPREFDLPQLVTPELVHGLRRKFLIRILYRMDIGEPQLTKSQLRMSDNVFVALSTLSTLTAPTDWESIRLLPEAEELGY